MKGTRTPLLRYGFSVGAVVFATLLTLLLEPIIAPSLFPIFFAAVMVAAWYGGLGPGLLATVLSSLAVDYFLITAPSHPVAYSLRLGIFGLVALLISSLTAARKRAEEELRRAHDALEVRVHERTRELADRNSELLRLQTEMARVEPLAALGRITGTIAHELGTPLNSVLGYCQLMGQEDLSESNRRRLKVVEGEIQRMVDVIQLHLSRARGALPEHSQVNVSDLVRETTTLLAPVFRQHTVSINLSLAESLPRVRGDAASLRRLLINLLDNAVDAIGKDGRVTVATRLQPALETGRAGVVIEVKDDGPGIPAEILPKIFDLFMTTKVPGKGTGLGLAICQEIVKAHGGTIEVTSRVGEGTCARIFLPADEQGGEPSPVEEKE